MYIPSLLITADQASPDILTSDPSTGRQSSMYREPWNVIIYTKVCTLYNKSYTIIQNIICRVGPMVLPEGRGNVPVVEYSLHVPYSWKYWRALNLAVEAQIAIRRILADLNLAVRYGIAMRIYASRKFWRILIWRL